MAVAAACWHPVSIDGGDRLLRNGPYGYYGYGYAPYGWGFDYGVRMRPMIVPFFAMPDDPHTPLPGSAPPALRDLSQEESLTRAFNELLKGTISKGVSTPAPTPRQRTAKSKVILHGAPIEPIAQYARIHQVQFPVPCLWKMG